METLNQAETSAEVKLDEVSKKSVVRTFQKAYSIISSDSGSVRYENDYDEEEVVQNPQVENLKLGDDFYISSEDESSNQNFDLKRTKALDRDLKEESKFNMSGKNRKESLYQSDSTLIKPTNVNSQQKTNSASDLQSKPKTTNVMHDDWFFSEVDSHKLKIQQNLKSKSFELSNE
ncbi:hypothetical protein BpHYR1_002305 [Brachionus plicatilis]|uniref:Uncharacterized protein n=1 Tax=Brachionus plicatilis TaxID=10195 RepID=A0A3M7RV35_BRAPC|nr:hypothetical protein BpHYR1_002305 [Brachionus plicatilis]